MASIMLIMMDSKNGSVSANFDLEDKDMQRIYDGYINKDKEAHAKQLDNAPTFEDKQLIGDFEAPSAQDICGHISSRFIQDIVATAYNAEVNATIKQLGIFPIQVKSKQ